MFRNINRKTNTFGDAIGSIKKGFAYFGVPGNVICSIRSCKILPVISSHPTELCVSPK